MAKHIDIVFSDSESSWFRAKWGRGGIYGIINKENLKIYIGSAVNILHRWHCHKSELVSKTHSNKYLQNAYSKCPEAFDFVLIEIVKDNSNLLEREQFWMDFYKSHKRESGYNLAPKAHSNLGMIVSEETKLKISKFFKGKTPNISDEERKRRSNSMRALWCDPIYREKFSTGRLGAKNTPESIKKMEETRKNNGYYHKPIICIKLSGEDVSNFKNVREASNKLKISRHSIFSVISGKRNSVFGYKFQRI